MTPLVRLDHIPVFLQRIGNAVIIKCEYRPLQLCCSGAGKCLLLYPSTAKLIDCRIILAVPQLLIFIAIQSLDMRSVFINQVRQIN